MKNQVVMDDRAIINLVGLRWAALRGASSGFGYWGLEVAYKNSTHVFQYGPDGELAARKIFDEICLRLKENNSDLPRQNKPPLG